MDYLSQHIESLIFSSTKPLTANDIATCLSTTFGMEFKEEAIVEAVDELMERYKSELFSFEIVEISKGYQFLTKGSYHGTIGNLLRQNTKKRLSRAALETLSIIAYRQPISKGELEKIRGVNCDYAVQKLLEKELVIITGRSDGPGRPLLYGTSDRFMNYFGIKSLQDLPKLKEFKTAKQTLGETAPIDEQVPSMNADSRGTSISDSEE